MSKDRFTASRYHLISAAQKRAESLARVRDREVTCPHCQTRMMPGELLAHIEARCSGQPPAPGPGARWITHREALQLGVPRATLSFWASSKQVRFVGERQDRKYLFGDLALKIAQRRGIRRR